MLRPWGLLIALILVRAAGAQGNPFDGEPIADIQFSPRQPLDPADLAKALSMKKGDALRASDVAAAIDGLFATGRFTDIAADAEPSASGVVLRFEVQLASFIGDVVIQGRLSAPPNRPELQSALQLSLGAPFHDQDVAAAVQTIQQLLTSNGMYHSEVTSQIKTDDELQQVTLTFQIKEHKRAHYAYPVIQGNTLLPEGTIVHATGWRVPLIHLWRQVTEGRTSGGVRGILEKYQKQQRLTATARISNLDYDNQKNKVTPTLEITPGPKVEITALESKVSKGTLKRYVPVYEENAVYNDLLVEGQRNLQDYFQSKGYYDAGVEFKQLPPEGDVEKIEYTIARGRRYKLVRVEIRGNSYFPASVIRERLFLQPSALNLPHGRYSEAFRRKDEQTITELYQTNGFHDVKVTTSADRDYHGKSGQVAVVIHIDEGAQWAVDHLDVKGVSEANRERVTRRLMSMAGQPFAEANLASDRNYVLAYYNSHGYPDANFEAAWSPAAAPHHVDVTYTITEGDRQYVRQVVITGLEHTRRSLVDRTLGIHAGDPLSPTAQLDAQQRLYDLGVFARVETAVQNPDGDTDHKYLLYTFDEADRYRVTIGVGAQVADFGTPSTTTLAAPGGTTGFSPQGSLDISRIDFLGLGHTLTLKTAYSSIEKRASLSYLQPRIHNIHGLDVTYAIIYDNELDIRTFASRREEGSVQISDRFSKTLTGLLKFAYRRVSVGSVIIPVLLVPQFLQPVRIGMLSVNIDQDRRDNPANPTHGMYNTIDAGIAGGFFGSQRSFARVLLRNATYYHLWGKVILARQTRFGVIEPFHVPAGLDPQQSVPLAERFFGGGADSIRGFGYNEAGPRDIGAPLVPGGPASQPTGFPLGGNALVFNNVELRFPLIGQNIQGVIFHDMGNIYTSLRDISFRYSQRNLQDFDYANQAPGIGIRYKTPVGPLRLDLAYSLNPPSFNGFGGTPVQLLQCNPNLPPSALPSYCQSTRQTLSHLQFFFSIGQTF